MGTTALVLGIIGLAIGWIPVVACFGWIACVLAIVFGGIGLSKAGSGKATNRGSAIAGMSLGIIGFVIGLILTIAVWDTFSSISDISEVSDEPEAVEEPVPADEAEEEEAETDPAEDEPQDAQGIGAGIWEVGADIEAGTYVTTPPGDGVFDGCYVARLSGFSGEFEDIIANANIDGGGRGRITIDESDTGVEFTGDCTWQLAGEDNLADPGAEVGRGVWEVGTEVEPGTYVTQAEGEGALDGCYVARLSGFSGEFEDIIANENIDGGAQGRITIDESDTGVEFSGECVWTLQ